MIFGELLFWVLLGCAAGCFTGLVPGVHVNTVVLVALSASFFVGWGGVVFIVAMSVVHSFVDFVPAILVGVPEGESFLSVLPGHRLLLRGEGLSAIKLTIVGGVLGLLVSLIFFPFFVLFVVEFNALLYLLIVPLLLFVLVSLFIFEKSWSKKGIALLCVLLSGVLGIIVLGGGFLREGLFPLVTGFFGGATILQSMRGNSKMVKQKQRLFSCNLIEAGKGASYGALAGTLVSLLPSVGPSQAAFIVRRVFGGMRSEGYLVVLGAINTCNAIYAFAVLYLVGKMRTGAAAGVAQLVDVDLFGLGIIFGSVLIAAGFGAVVAEFFGVRGLEVVRKVDYGVLNKLVFAGLLGLVWFFSGFLGVVAFFSACGVAMFALLSGVRRGVCMAFLMVPTILFYWVI